ncbi:elongator complex protein 6 [Osmerus mordax]|uniref:elongator complex protein 6 n=1 Tax=Osmerus mordax TaxID=8014 RepID=UPI00350EB41C
MFGELNSILNTSPDDFTRGEFTLVSDRQTDASFLIHHFLSFYLRAGCRVCFLGLVQSFSHYSSVSQRIGVNLAQAREKGQLIFLEGLKESLKFLLHKETKSASVYHFLRDSDVGLRELYKFVCGSVVAESEEWGPPVLLVDDLSVLLSLGVSVESALDFSHYCKATICSELQGSMVMLVRCEGEDEEEVDNDEESSERLMRGLTHQCSLTLKVQGLSTGYCKDIHGQVEVCWRGQGYRQQNQRKLFQYKVHDKGASFFARGTSNAVL